LHHEKAFWGERGKIMKREHTLSLIFQWHWPRNETRHIIHTYLKIQTLASSCDIRSRTIFSQNLGSGQLEIAKEVFVI
jgi:hypothetical protein